MLCPFHWDDHDRSKETLQERKKCYYCTTPLEDHLYLQKLTQKVADLKLGQKKYISSPSSNVYNSRLRKENTCSSRCAEVIPPQQKHSSTALAIVHDHIREKAAHNTHFRAPGAYLHYLSTIIQPEDFCTAEELCLFPERKTTR